MFRMLGNKVELIRYVVSYETMNGPSTEQCVSDLHRDEVIQRLMNSAVPHTVETIDQSLNEWFNGLTFDSYDVALQTLNAGKDAYDSAMETKSITDPLKIRADLDFIAIMTGVTI